MLQPDLDHSTNLVEHFLIQNRNEGFQSLILITPVPQLNMEGHPLLVFQ